MFKINKLYANIYIQYMILFFIIFVLIFIPYWYYDKGFIWEDDGPLVHYPTFIYCSNYLKNLIINLYNGDFILPLFDFRIEGGGDVLQILHTHALGDPFNLLTLFFSENRLEFCYNFLIILRMFLSGFVLCILGRYFKFDKNGILLGALMYCFCGYAIFASIKHPYFTNPMIFLPLLILGIEKILQENKYKLFLICLPIAGISSFYFFYMIILFLICYLILRMIYIYYIKKEVILKLTVKILITMILGIGIASSILLPMIFFILSTSRGGGYELPFIYLYPIKVYTNMIEEFFIGYKNPGFWTILHYPLICFFSLLIIFKYKKLKYLKALFIINTIIIFVPILGYIWNGGAYISNRNIWCYSLLISFIFIASYKYLFYILEDYSKYIERALLIFIIFNLLFIAITFIDSYMSLKIIGYNKSYLKYLYINNIIIIVGLIILFIILKINNVIYKEKILFFTIIFNIVFNGLYVTSNLGGNYAEQFLKNGDINNYTVWDNSFKTNLKSNLFYRIEINKNENNTRNNSLIENYSELSSRYSLSGKSFTEFYDIMQLPRQGLVRTGIDNRTVWDAISNVLYVKNYKNDEYLYPYGFEKIENNLMKNKYLLPIGYTYDKFFIRNSKMNVLDIEGNILDYVALEKNINGVENITIKNRTKLIESNIHYDNNIKIDNNPSYIYVKKKNSKINITFKKNENILGEYYLYIPCIELLNKYGKGATNSVIYFKSNNLNKCIGLSSKNHAFFLENNGILINLGWTNDNENIEIILENKGQYKLYKPKILFLPLEGYEKKIKNLKSNALKNVNIETNKVTGDININKKKILFLSIPFSEGWTAYVDGKKTEIYKANVMYMAIPLEIGQHHIELKYRTPYLNLGIGISILSLILSIIWILYLKKTR